jgi:hypothetical protein
MWRSPMRDIPSIRFTIECHLVDSGMGSVERLLQGWRKRGNSQDATSCSHDIVSRFFGSSVKYHDVCSRAIMALN